MLFTVYLLLMLVLTYASGDQVWACIKEVGGLYRLTGGSGGSGVIDRSFLRNESD
jgi:hypothetical protein